MKLIEDAIDKNFLLAQLHTMMDQKRVLMSTSAGSNNSIGMAYDAGYMACLTELERILIWPPKDQDKKQDLLDNDDEEGEDYDDR